MRITVVGAGYVGLVCAAGLADLGNEVVGVDVDDARIARLQRGEVPILEPRLDDLVADNVRQGRLRFTADLSAAVEGAEVVFVTVGTPDTGHGHADVSAVLATAEAVAAHATRELVLVLKSTVPVGTHARVRRLVAGAAVPIHVVSNPEFFKEGSAVSDFQRPARVIVGVTEGDELARRTMQRVYRPLSLDADRILWMDPASAELSKYVANAMLAMRVAFMNEVAVLCERVDADVHAVRLAVGSDPRIGPKFLYAGPGYGGSCFPKDVVALVRTARDLGVDLELAATTHTVNERHKGVVLRKLERHFDGDLHGRRIAVWGASFKPDTDDVRDAPTLTLVDGLLAAGALVAVHDPAALDAVRARYATAVRTCADPYEAAEGADGLVLMTEWGLYRSPDFQRLAAIMAKPLLIDGRNIWSAYGLREQGFVYEGIGART